MRAIVTGGAGFIGSHVVDVLLEEGFKVTAVDSFATGYPMNLAHLKTDERFRFIRSDLRTAKNLDSIVSGSDVVFHMAAHADVRKSLVNRRADLDNNVIGTLNLLEAMMKCGTTDLVFASSSAVYGEATQIPTPEDYYPSETSLYGASKLACEAFAQAYTQLFPLRFWSFRFANVIGPRCRRGVIWDFVRKLGIDASRLEILGNGKQSKEYLHVQDCVDGMMIAFSKSKRTSNIFNLGHEKQTTVDRVADLVISQLGLSNVKKIHTGGAKGWVGDIPLVALSIDRIKSLGWRPRMSSDDAIRVTTKWTAEDPLTKV